VGAAFPLVVAALVHPGVAAAERRRLRNAAERRHDHRSGGAGIDLPREDRDDVARPEDGTEEG
jgi:hypothetical protein